MLEKPGALMLYPIYDLLFGEKENDKGDWRRPFLELTEDQIAISYKTYKTDDPNDMQAITDGNLAPGIMTRKLSLCEI